MRFFQKSSFKAGRLRDPSDVRCKLFVPIRSSKLDANQLSIDFPVYRKTTFPKQTFAMS